ncbi:MAG: hypothetical protein PHY46_03090 [Candidatus Omnitrophica bacterium]|nr:hypothetical protein [Candidatus Omnitrophota bacterium]MDD5356304.1 hypothetical protein [Candidatus Omnitrophota bacterium]
MRKNKIPIIISCLFVLMLAVYIPFGDAQDLNDKKWDDLEKMPKSLPAPMPEEYKTLPTPVQEDPIKDMRFQEKYRFPKQTIEEIAPKPLIIDQQAQDRAVLENQRKWRQMMESQKPNLFKRFDEWLEVFNIPKEYHFAIELFLAALFIVFFGIMYYRRGVKKKEEEKTFRMPPR